MAIKPINGNVLVKPLEAPELTSGGIHLPDNAKEQRREGEIKAVAEDAIEEVTVGDRVIYKDFSGTDVQVGGENYTLLTSDDILVKYVETDEIPG